jgi:hypothetical protein
LTFEPFKEYEKKEYNMGRIAANIRITNLLEREKTFECDTLVDTGVASLALPKAWQKRLEKLNFIR